MKNILLIFGHPNKKSFCDALMQEYIKGVSESHNNLKLLYLTDMKFNKILEFGYSGLQELEPDLINAQLLIKWADHLVFVYPNWWYTQPALLKAFIDRVLLPDFAFKYSKTLNGIKHEKLLINKSASLIVTMDTPVWYYKFILGDPGYKMMNNSLDFCGIKLVDKYYFGPIISSTEEQRNKWLKEIYNAGINL